jgi:hypothetical protein
LAVERACACGDGADWVGVVLGAAVAWPVVWAGAVRANKAAKPTAVTVLSWVGGPRS